MILIDSSAWIEYYKPSGDARVKKAVYRVIQEDEAAINGLILVEIAGYARDSVRSLILSDFGAFHSLPLSDSVFLKAADICGTLREQGVTVPATDAIIAACALESNASLLHRDSHFEQIARHYPLQLI